MAESRRDRVPVTVGDFLQRRAQDRSLVDLVMGMCGDIFGTAALIPNVEIMYFTSVESLKPHVSRMITNIAVFYGQDQSAGIDPEYNQVFYGDMGRFSKGFVVLPIIVTLNGGEEARLILGAGDRRQSLCAHSLKSSGNRWTRVYPRVLQDYCDSAIDTIAVEDCSKAIETYIVVGTGDQLLSFIATPGFPQQDRMATVFTAMFPYIKEWAQSTLITISYDDYITRHSSVAPTPIPPSEEARIRLHQAATVQACLGTAYSREDMVEKQLYRRYKAACANMQLETMTESQFAEAYGCFGRDTYANNPHILELLGRVLAIREDYSFDITVTVRNLANLTQLMDHFHISKFSGAMLEQMRMVHSHSQHTSVIFGLSILPLIRTIFPAKGGDYDRQFTAACDLRETIESQLFVGLVRVLPEMHKIKTIALVVYVGVLYHQRVALEEQQGDTFAKFNIEGIAKHIARMEDRNLCKSIADFLPMGGIVTLGVLCQFVSEEQINLALSRREDVSAISLYRYLRTLGTHCDWRDGYERKLALDVLENIESTQVPRLNANLDSVRDRFLDAMLRNNGGQDRMGDYNRIVQASAMIRTRLQAVIAQARESLDDSLGKNHEALIPVFNLMRNIISASVSWTSENFGQGIDAAPPPAPDAN